MKTSEQIDSLTPYYDPQLKLLKVHKIDALDKWHYDGFRVGFWRLYWNRQPGAEVHFKNRVQPLSPDRLVLVPAYTVLSQRLPRPPVGHWFVHFTVDPPFDRVRDKIFTFPADEDAMRRIWAETPPDVCGDVDTLRMSLRVRALILDLLARIPPADIDQAPAISEPLERGIAYIAEHLGESLRNRDIARQMNLSVNAAMHEFHAGLDMPMQGYVRHMRNERACLLLHDRRLSMEAIADACGYCDRYHFSRAFKAQFGMTPLAYRRWLDAE